MPQFVQVLGPAADGQGMTLDSKKLQEMFRTPAVKDLPVVVLAAVGPRGSGKTTLLSAIQRSISGGSMTSKQSGMGPGATSAGMVPETVWAGTDPQPQSTEPGQEMQWATAASQPPQAALVHTPCDADRPGSAGAAVWSELLPVTLPTGDRAMLLLLDTWGPFDDSCPEQQRTSVLLFSALISSTLVVLTSARSPVCPLGDLTLLAKLGAAAQDVRHCSPLQELVLLVKDWRGPAQYGRQADFRPLQYWMEGDTAAKQALMRMMEATDWYNEGDAFLFLVPDQTAGVTATGDPVGLLTAPRSAKRFEEDDASIPAGNLAEYLEILAAALAKPSCDVSVLLQALIEANQRVAALAARSVYEEKMKQLERQWQIGPVSEQELRGAHNRAAHDVLMAFTMSRKMDSEKTDSEKLKNELQQWLEEQYRTKREAILTDAEKLEKEAVERRSRCKESYKSLMESAFKDSPKMTMAELIKNHDKYRLEVLSEFDKGSHRHSQQHMDLSDDLEKLFREFANELDKAKEEAEVAEAEKSLVTTAEKSAEKLYREIMEAVKPEKLSSIHRRVQECAELQFDSKTKTLPDEHKSEARERLAKHNKATLQDLLDRAQHAARMSSAAGGIDHRAISRQFSNPGSASGHSGYNSPRPTSIQEPAYGGQVAGSYGPAYGSSQGLGHGAHGPGYAQNWGDGQGGALCPTGEDRKPSRMKQMQNWMFGYH